MYDDRYDDNVYNQMFKQSAHNAVDAKSLQGTFIPSSSNVGSEAMRVTPIEELVKYKDGVVVKLPGFAPGVPWYAQIKRPSLMSLAANGKVPNSLMAQATDLFAKGAGAMVGVNNTVIKDVYDVVMIVCEAALVKPSMDELRKNGIVLTDEQLMAIFSYTQEGVKALERFFPE